MSLPDVIALPWKPRHRGWHLGGAAAEPPAGARRSSRFCHFRGDVPETFRRSTCSYWTGIEPPGAGRSASGTWWRTCAACGTTSTTFESTESIRTRSSGSWSDNTPIKDRPLPPRSSTPDRPERRVLNRASLDRTHQKLLQTSHRARRRFGLGPMFEDKYASSRCSTSEQYHPPR